MGARIIKVWGGLLSLSLNVLDLFPLKHFNINIERRRVQEIILLEFYWSEERTSIRPLGLNAPFDKE